MGKSKKEKIKNSSNRTTETCDNTQEKKCFSIAKRILYYGFQVSPMILSIVLFCANKKMADNDRVNQLVINALNNRLVVSNSYEVVSDTSDEWSYEENGTKIYSTNDFSIVIDLEAGMMSQVLTYSFEEDEFHLASGLNSDLRKALLDSIKSTGKYGFSLKGKVGTHFTKAAVYDNSIYFISSYVVIDDLDKSEQFFSLIAFANIDNDNTFTFKENDYFIIKYGENNNVLINYLDSISKDCQIIALNEAREVMDRISSKLLH